MRTAALVRPARTGDDLSVDLHDLLLEDVARHKHVARRQVPEFEDRLIANHASHDIAIIVAACVELVYRFSDVAEVVGAASRPQRLVFGHLPPLESVLNGRGKCKGTSAQHHVQPFVSVGCLRVGSVVHNLGGNLGRRGVKGMSTSRAHAGCSSP